MLRINNHAANLDLTILGWIRQGEVRCTACGQSANWPVESKTNRFVFTDPLLGREANGQHCSVCGQPLTQQAIVTV